jgi:hypothetical protein
VDGQDRRQDLTIYLGVGEEAYYLEMKVKPLFLFPEMAILAKAERCDNRASGRFRDLPVGQLYEGAEVAEPVNRHS